MKQKLNFIFNIIDCDTLLSIGNDDGRGSGFVDILGGGDILSLESFDDNEGNGYGSGYGSGSGEGSLSGTGYDLGDYSGDGKGAGDGSGSGAGKNNGTG